MKTYTQEEMNFMTEQLKKANATIEDQKQQLQQLSFNISIAVDALNDIINRLKEEITND